jgi:hypothetical protein
MALINKLGRYIKLDKDDHFEIYINEEARQKFKTSTPSELIIKKYLEIIGDLTSDKYDEARYYNRIEHGNLVASWMQEYQRYTYNLANYIYTEEFPLMAAYYSDVADSIPKLVAKGTFGGVFGKHAKTAEEAYIQAKQDESWGETTDA